MNRGRAVPKPQRPVEPEAPTINYDDSGLLEHAVGDTEYRLDVGKQGTALALSSRPVDTWDWSYVAELKWDGRSLSGRALRYETLQVLSRALLEAMED